MANENTPPVTPAGPRRSDRPAPDYVDIGRGPAIRRMPRRPAATPEPTRLEGYRTGTSRDEAGLLAATDFLSRLLGIPGDQLHAGEQGPNRDGARSLILPGGRSLYVLQKSINPDRYPLNYVEVAELAFNPRHPGGAGALARALDIPTDSLADAQVRDFRPDTPALTTFGRPEHVSVSMTPLLESTATMYINPDDGHVYVYSQEEIRRHIRRAVLNNSLRRGQRTRSEDGLAVLIPLARWRFSKGKDGRWRFSGPGEPEPEKTALRALLS
jgi:hypothetical protein